MIVPEKPLWEGNKNVCMYVCTNPMNVGRPQKLGFFPKKVIAALKAQRNGSVNSCTRASSVWAKRLARVDMRPSCLLA